MQMFHLCGLSFILFSKGYKERFFPLQHTKILKQVSVKLAPTLMILHLRQLMK
jgi:hypothetical protein